MMSMFAWAQSLLHDVLVRVQRVRVQSPGCELCSWVFLLLNEPQHPGAG